MRSIDHHCTPFVIILLHACRPSLTLHEVSRTIWNESSAYNYRYSRSIPSQSSDLYLLQDWVRRGSPVLARESRLNVEESPPSLTLYESRLAFMCLFSQSFKSGKSRACYAGTDELPAKLMINKSWSDSKALPMILTTVKSRDLPLPLGHSWTKEKYEVEVRGGVPLVDGQPLPWYDASSLVVKKTLSTTRASSEEVETIESVLGKGEVSWYLYESLLIEETERTEVPEWQDVDADLDLVCALLTRLEECGDVFEVGPIDRNGSGTKRALYEHHEGRLWGAMALFTWLYPGLVTWRSNITFHLERLARDHITSSLRAILSRLRPLAPLSEEEGEGSVITPLWEHQRDSVQRISSSFDQGAFGAGDAGDVGSGKTLIAITIALTIPGKSLILVNTPALLPTWEGEVTKHTRGVKYRVQAANGKWSGDESAKLWISTLARLRDHPTSERWSLLVIDECLSVQNNKALWTAEAWRQSIFASHVLMLSATFFRSRYDKLYFMLKILRTGLPERKEYLDAILIETMVSQQPSKTREWEVTHYPIEVGRDVLDAQRKVMESSATVEAKYSKIVSILHDVDVVESLKDIVTSPGPSATSRRCLIYARSGEEATHWSKSLSIPIYPDISRQHVIVTLSRGTYGLNDLVKYNTIVCRPPEPDRLPQMKGRLDRPGQSESHLELVLFYLADTIEEGGLKRLDVTRQFDRYYKMPLSRYYELSLQCLE